MSFTTSNIFSSQQIKVDDSEDDSLIRVCYICKSLSNKAPWEELLLEMGIAKPEDEEEENMSLVEAPPTLNVRVRALRCLSKMKNKENIKIEHIDNFNDYLKKLQLLERLESLGFGYELEQLNNGDKCELVKKIGQSYGHNPKAISIMASICHQFDLGQPLLWETILKKFNQLSKYCQTAVSKLFHTDLLPIFYESFDKLAMARIVSDLPRLTIPF